MPLHSRRIFGAATALLLAATVAQAQGKGHDKEHGKGKDKDAKELRVEGRDDRDHDRDGNRDEIDGRRRDGNTGVWRDGRDGHGRRDDRDVLDNSGRRIPPGLAKKPGGMPPGQYKKHYQTSEGASVLRDILLGRGYTVVRTDNAGQSQYVYYRLRDGSVQRAIVSPGTDRLGFTNVPSALLREVLARLY